jgi:hypothetical protein
MRADVEPSTFSMCPSMNREDRSRQQSGSDRARSTIARSSSKDRTTRPPFSSGNSFQMYSALAISVARTLLPFHVRQMNGSFAEDTGYAIHSFLFRGSFPTGPDRSPAG